MISTMISARIITTLIQMRADPEITTEITTDHARSSRNDHNADPDRLTERSTLVRFNASGPAKSRYVIWEALV